MCEGNYKALFRGMGLFVGPGGTTGPYSHSNLFSSTKIAKIVACSSPSSAQWAIPTEIAPCSSPNGTRSAPLPTTNRKNPRSYDQGAPLIAAVQSPQLSKPFKSRLPGFITLEHARVEQHVHELAADFLLQHRFRAVCRQRSAVLREHRLNQAACLCSRCAASSRIALPKSASPVRILAISASSSCRRPGSTASPITSIKPMFSFLMWCKF